MIRQNRYSNSSIRGQKRVLITATGLGIAGLLACCLGIYFAFNFGYGIGNQFYEPEVKESLMTTNSCRLPDNLIPSEYHLTLKTYLPSPVVSYDSGQNFTFEGQVIIIFSSKRTTDKIILNADRITLDQGNGKFLLKNLNNGEQIGLRESVTYNTRDQIFVFILDRMLNAGQNFSLTLTYKSRLSDDIKGYYRTRYMDRGKEKWLAVTQFQPTDARRALPCFDEPSYKAKIILTMHHPSNMKALGNAKDIETKQSGDGWSVTYFESTPSMSTYLFAFFVGEFSHVEARANTVEKTLFRVWTRPELINQTKWAASSGPKLLEFYENYFGVEFPLGKQDLLAVPQLSFGAMENWGLVTYRESDLLYETKLYPLSVKQSVASIEAHELAHQWFGDLVTMRWWDDLWLNEGFASYMQYKATDAITDCGFQMSNQFGLETQKAMELDQLPTSHPIYVSVSTPNQINEIFDDISYSKGAAVLNMLNHTLGHEVFNKGLHDYLNKHQYSTASHDDLWVAMQEAANQKQVKGWREGEVIDIEEFMNRWIKQMNFPIVTAQRLDSETINVTQERFLLIDDIKNIQSPYNYQWYTPLWYRNQQNGAIEQTWLVLDNELRLKGPAFGQKNTKWYLLDPEVSGYYRVNYDEHNWQFLKEQMLEDPAVLDVRTRSQLLDDAMTLARADRLNYNFALGMTKYLKDEQNYIPWSTALSHLGYIGQMLTLYPSYGLYKEYMRQLISPIYEQIGNSEETEDVLLSKLKSMITGQACNLGIGNCKKMAEKLFAEIYKNCSGSTQLTSDFSCNNVPVDLRGTVYCAGVKKRELIAWEFLYQKYQLETVSSERDSLLEGMSCTSEPWLIIRLLNATIDGAIARSDGQTVYRHLKSNPVAMQTMWSYFVDNWDLINKELGSSLFQLRRFIAAATSSFNTQQQYDMVKSFIDSHSDLGTGERTLHQQLSNIRTNQQWMEKYSKIVISWFKANI